MDFPRVTADDIGAIAEAIRNISDDDRRAAVEFLATVDTGELVPAVLAIRKAARAMVLSRDDVLKHAEVITERVDVPEWGGDVIVRGMTGRERDAWEASMFRQQGKRMIANPDNVRAKLVARCVVDEDGRRLFMDSDVDALGGLAAAPISRIYDVAARLSGVSEADVEEMTRDFTTTPGDDSSSGSPTTSTSPSETYSGEQTPSS